MWRFVSQSSSDRHPHLRSLNEHIGRQTWEWDPDAGTQEDRDKVEQLRAAFVASKDTQKHSSDELLRLQVLDPPLPTLSPSAPRPSRACICALHHTCKVRHKHQHGIACNPRAGCRPRCGGSGRRRSRSPS